VDGAVFEGGIGGTGSPSGDFEHEISKKMSDDMMINGRSVLFFIFLLIHPFFIILIDTLLQSLVGEL